MPDAVDRAIARILADRLRAFPVVVLTGARQTGKSTLVRSIDLQRRYLTLDDYGVLDQALNAPDALLSRDGPLTLDEVQRAPDLLLGIKRAVDRNRSPGSFLLTGSANLRLMQSVSETLAGRAVYLTLSPLTVSEVHGLGGTAQWDVLLDVPSEEWLSALDGPRLADDWAWTLSATLGGFPDPSLHLQGDANRAAWFDGYVRTYLERDLQQLTNIENLVGFQRLVRATAARVGSLLNQAEVARDVGLPSSTVQRYLGLLEPSSLLNPLPPYSVNRGKRLIKSPKAFWADTGLAAHLAGNLDPTGAHLENMILGDLLTWRETRTPRPAILFWRTAKGAEVDFVIETATGLVPIEVKTRRTARVEDARHVELFLDEYADRTTAGVVLYDGREAYRLTERVYAIPLRTFMA